MTLRGKEGGTRSRKLGTTLSNTCIADQPLSPHRAQSPLTGSELRIIFQKRTSMDPKKSFASPNFDTMPQPGEGKHHYTYRESS